MKKTIKIITCIILCLGMMFVFCACGNPTPTETADTFLSAVKAQDQETANTVYAGKNFNIMDSMSESEDTDDEDNESFDALFEETMTEKLLDFDYTLSNEKINGTKATVDAEIKTYEFGKAMTNTMTKYIEKALPLAFSGASESELEKIMNDAFEEEFGALKDKTCTTNVTINLIQEDDVWKVAEIDSEGDVMNAISGNMVNAILEINDSFSEWE